MKYLKYFENNEDLLEEQLCDAILFYNLDKFDELIKDFKNRNYSFDYIDDGGWTPATIAVYKGRKDMLDILLKNGADINFGNRLGYTPLMIAGDENDFTILTYLIEKDADWNIECETGEDFMYFTTDEYLDIIIEDYPEKYKEYLSKKDAKKYNL